MSVLASDLNLFFAVLALQNELVGKDALLAALGVWGREKHRLLADILVERGALLADDRQLIDGLIERQLRRHASAEKSLAAMSVTPALRQQVQSLCPPEMDASLAYLSGADDSNNTVGYAAPEAGLRYRILRPHARGGLGEVFVALDTELHREIALKQIQARHAAQNASRGRFILEAEITGGLEHPGIVPVYGLGTYADGRPFYAMRFIKGENLKEAIAQFHHGSAAGSAKSVNRYARLEFRQLLGRFIDVCNAVAYAHSRGVLHRDLKPSNIMLGKFGETLVVDWGLAKVLGRAVPSEPAGELIDEATLTPASGSGIAETVAGSAIGTPAYMSPEQAAGRIANLSPATDVYSLGATFFTLLTGQSPVTDAETAEILHKVERGTAGFSDPAAEAGRGAVPAPLVAICRKAMMLEPRDRYASPLALAEDLEHWLADEPVSACPDPWTVRAGRWVRRHRTAVTSAVAALAVALVCLAVATGLLSAARESEHQAKVLAEENEQKAQVERDKARARFVLARDAVDKYHTQVSESPELKSVGLEKLRTRLLETAAAFYEKFVKDGEADVSVAAERGHAYRRLGGIYEEIGQHADADKAFLQSLAVWQQLADEHRGEPTIEAQLAEGHRLLGWLYQQINRNAEAETHLLRSLAIWTPLVERHPDELGYQSFQASALQDLGILYKDTSRPGLAKEAVDKALSIRTSLVAAAPENDEFRLGLERSHTQRGNILLYAGKPAEAEKSYQQAVEIAQHLIGKDPSSPEHLSGLSVAHYNLGFAYQRFNQRAKALSAYQDALKLDEKLAEEHPAVVKYQTRLAGTQNQLAAMYGDMNKLTRADVLYKQSQAIREKLYHAYPQVPDFAVDLAGTYCNRGDLLSESNDFPAATDLYLLAKKMLDAVLDKDNRHAVARRYLLNVHRGLGSVYREQGLKDEAEVAYREIVQMCEKQAEELPDATEQLLDLSGALCNYGHRLFENDQPEPAIDAYTRATERLAGLLKKVPTHQPVKTYLANSLWGRARALSKSVHRHGDALKDMDRALTLTSGTHRDWLRGARAVMLARSGEYAQAVADAREVSDKTSAGPSILMEAAFTHAVAAATVHMDAQLAAAERDRLAEQYAAQAVALLSRAAAKKQFDSPVTRADLDANSELNVLRSRPDFKKLLAGLDKPKKAGN